MRSLGICFGATTMQCVELARTGTGTAVARTLRIAHDGNPKKAFLDFCATIPDPESLRIAVTGRAFRQCVALSSISEPEAVECALSHVYKKDDLPSAVVSSGGETQLVYTITAGGHLGNVLSGNKCASGTGEFFLQQIRRMGLALDEAVTLALEGVPHRIAGRCSVFCKSDCTHALNKGESKANIAAGLCLMMADKIHELIKSVSVEKLAVIGGGSLNSAMIALLKQRYPQIELPPQASCFEAYGAALWALDHDCRPFPKQLSALVTAMPDSFSRHRPLREAMGLVEFRESRRAQPQPGDRCILGLDVGSTTTKAVLMRQADQAIIASIYLRTNGDPVRASRDCYKALREQVGSGSVEIVALGVTGSGRQIAALHALSDNVINEIIAHAAAAAFFDPEVDTIFEIGGQDAKYTYLTGGVASDYAMNEACSAGTGSFLEESAKESLNVATEEIADLAIQGKNPPNFTDQCAAFISSDIKTAGQEGIGREDILGGLVYSICLNYLNRVKGSRPAGKKIFIQGGVCYNRAVPLAMASLINTKIIVPPDPGLMGAFGVALEVANRIRLGISQAGRFNLDELIERDAVREGSFICAGGAEHCDRKCEILRIRIAGALHPFGGVCNRYYNLRLHREIRSDDFDLVALRQRLMFEEFGIGPSTQAQGPTVGIMRSFLVQSLYPLYSNFFDRLGFSILLSDAIDPEGVARIESSFCLPAEIAHGSFYNLLTKKPDFIFLPQVSQIPVPSVPIWSKTCVFVQGEPYYLKTTFRKEVEGSGIRFLSPVLKMDKSYQVAADDIVSIAAALGKSEAEVREAWAFACRKQVGFEDALQAEGKKALDKIKAEHRFGIVLFGRPYSAFSTDANKGIPHKTASRGYVVIPYDMLPAADEEVDERMYWATGQKIMKAAAYVKKHPDLFGFYVTNFSCGPDSFLLGYFRRQMGSKPSLTLEVDQHTADAGIDTRVEAALDIMESYRRIAPPPAKPHAYQRAKIIGFDPMRVVSSQGTEYECTSDAVEIIVPNMGRYGTEALSAVLRGKGYHARALPIAGKQELLEGRRHATCKECLPYLVTTGSFMRYLAARQDQDRVTLLFMPMGGGPCRLGQYSRALSHIIEKNHIENAEVFSMTDENAYGGLGSRALLKAWQAIVVSDVVTEIRSMLAVAAKDPAAAIAVLDDEWKKLVSFFEGKSAGDLSSLLPPMAKRLAELSLKKKPFEVPKVSLVGEIFVRRDEFSRKNITEYLERAGFAVRVAPVSEYLCYSNFVVNNYLGERQFTGKEQLRMHLTSRLQEWWEWKIKMLLSASGLYRFEMVEVEKTIDGASHLFDPRFRGETILTTGLALREILSDSCGVISIGPFGCMPSRVAEAVLKKEMNVEGKRRMPGSHEGLEKFEELGDFPFLAIETDGMPFPQIIEANLESFLLQSRRVHDLMLKLDGHPQVLPMKDRVPAVKAVELLAKTAKHLVLPRKNGRKG